MWRIAIAMIPVYIRPSATVLSKWQAISRSSHAVPLSIGNFTHTPLGHFASMRIFYFIIKLVVNFKRNFVVFGGYTHMRIIRLNPHYSALLISNIKPILVWNPYSTYKCTRLSQILNNSTYTITNEMSFEIQWTRS